MTAKEYKNFIVEVKVRLMRRSYDSESDEEDYLEYRQDYETNMVKIDHNVKKPLKKFASDEINAKEFWMWLYYTSDLNGIVFHVLERNIEFQEHTFVVNIKARYIYPKGCTKKYLKKSIEGIFDHWFNAGYVTYILDKFNIISATTHGNGGEIAPDIFINLA